MGNVVHDFRRSKMAGHESFSCLSILQWGLDAGQVETLISVVHFVLFLIYPTTSKTSGEFENVRVLNQAEWLIES